MTTEAAAWVREHVWTPGMRKQFRESPAFYLRCACQYSASGHCQVGRHQVCTAAVPLPSSETAVLKRGGTHGAQFTEQHFHRSRTSRTGTRRHGYAEVWLADRVCRYRCPCDCHGPEPERVRVPTQLDLFPDHQERP